MKKYADKVYISIFGFHVALTYKDKNATWDSNK